MESKFKDYMELSGDEKKEIWDNAVFVFDTNILLNLYRYTKANKNDVLVAMEHLSKRVWIPYNVAEEFFNNRITVIYQTVEGYKELKKTVKAFEDKFTDDCKKLMRGEDNLSVSYIGDILKWVDDKYKQNVPVTSHSDDKILSNLLKIFKNKVGDAYSAEELKGFFTEGQARYAILKPPGFNDIKKPEPDRYGDFIIWKQILKYATENKKDIIFVTEDKKDDWWYSTRGKTIGPRFELRKEFRDETGKQFYMYTMQRFLEEFNKNTPVKLKNYDSLIKETRKMSNEQDFKLAINPLKNCFNLDFATKLAEFGALSSGLQRAQELSSVGSAIGDFGRLNISPKPITVSPEIFSLIENIAALNKKVKTGEMKDAHAETEEDKNIK